MLVACKNCTSKIERDNAYKVVNNGKNNYYCSEQEYNKMMVEKESRLNTIELCFEIIGKTTNTVLMKEIKEIAVVHSYEKILKYLQTNSPELIKVMTKSFTSEYAKIRYFTAIIKNQIGDFTYKKQDNAVSEIEVIEEVVYKSNTKKSFLDFIDEY